MSVLHAGKEYVEFVENPQKEYHDLWALYERMYCIAWLNMDEPVDERTRQVKYLMYTVLTRIDELEKDKQRTKHCLVSWGKLSNLKQKVERYTAYPNMHK